MPDDKHALLLGEIKGKLDVMMDTQAQHGTKLDGIDGRLRAVELTSSVHGALAGGVVSIGVALLIEKTKHTLGI